jgi:hypothetical protein
MVRYNPTFPTFQHLQENFILICLCYTRRNFLTFLHGQAGLASLIVIHDITKQVGWVYYYGARLCDRIGIQS